ncbi:HAD-IA family hydrolase [Actinopolymorpha singaporensis]|uniref:HAD-IA family hydrolase n=1 Tax=Actinopolymorpha singaporensis TaxID=117157 RepID=UPI001F5286DA|nr:HAD-IA family hydrolase [Actinopolymorpha singaporensis]
MTPPRTDHEPTSTPVLRAEAVLLDLDGTLIDSTEALRRSWTTWAIEQELTQQDFARVLGHGLTSAAIVAALVPPERIAAAQARIDELEVEDVAGIVALPGAQAFVSSLPAGRWTIVTSGNRAVAGARLRAAGLPVPDTLVSADDVRNGKPDPEPYLLGAKRLGIPPERCVVVEDAPAGLAAARAAGMATIAVTTHYERAELDADLVVEDLQNVRVEVDGDDLSIAVADGA